jgi:hypothetical protein
MKFYRIKHPTEEKYLASRRSISLSWDETGTVFSEQELVDFLRRFKYQMNLWRKGATFEEFEAVPTESKLGQQVFDDIQKELFAEKLARSK